MKKDKVITIRHRLFRYFALFNFGFYSHFITHYKKLSSYKIGKDEKVLIISNHQTDQDYFYLERSFNKPIYPVATESLFSNKFLVWFIPRFFGAIPKKKGEIDLSTTLNMMRYLRAGAPVCLFIEGNRPYGEFQFYINPDIGKQFKKMKATIILFNIEGGTGIRPRFSNKRRKGRLCGGIKRVLKYEEYENMPDEELSKIIIDGIRVYDSESNNLYKSKTKAEYLEREFFICPKCGKMECLTSKGNKFRCNNCGLEVEFTEDLHFKSSDESFTFRTLNDWYQYQKKYLREHEFTGTIFSDNYVDLYESIPYVNRKLIYSGSITLTDKELSFGDFLKIPVSEIEQASPVSGKNIYFSTKTCTYLLKGSERFNPLKYVLMFNKIDTAIKINGNEKYYSLRED